MPWFLPLAIGVGLLATKSVHTYRQEHHGSKASRGAWLLLFYGWMPLLAWLLNNLGSRR